MEHFEVNLHAFKVSQDRSEGMPVASQFQRSYFTECLFPHNKEHLFEAVKMAADIVAQPNLGS